MTHYLTQTGKKIHTSHDGKTTNCKRNVFAEADTTFQPADACKLCQRRGGEFIAERIETFGEQVQAIAMETPTGRIGRSLVYINHVWQHAAAKGWALGLDEFKARLRQAALDGEITLMVSNTFEPERKADMLASRIDDGFRRWELVNLSPDRVVF